jgi:hypothetical protein
MRVVADQVGIDQPPRHRGGFGRVAAAALHDGSHERDELCRRNDFHGRL